MIARHRRNLAELAELGMQLCRHLHQAALHAPLAANAAEFSNAFHRVSRSVRQSMALEAMLERKARIEQREATEARAEVRAAALRDRKAAIRAEVARLDWTEAERLRSTPAELEDLIGDLEDAGDLLDEPIDAQIDRIRESLGLTPAAPPREDPRPSGAPPAPAQPTATPAGIGRGDGLTRRRAPACALNSS